VEFGPVCKNAIERDIIVNTIHCGAEADGISGGWKDGAALADGRFLTINHNAQVANIKAPQDREIAELNAKLNATYLPFGAHGEAGKRRQAVQDQNAAQAPAPASVVASRAKAKASANYANSSWDLIDALDGKEIAFKDLKDDDLPEELRGLEPEKQQAVLAEKKAERAQLKARLLELSAEREKAVAAEKQKLESKTLDRAVTATVRNQAARKAFKFGQQ
jgi:hypothetical protein